MTVLDDTILFRCEVNGFLYLAHGNDVTVSMLHWANGSSSDVVYAIMLIAKTAKVYGYEIMTIFVDSLNPDDLRIMDYAKSKRGKATWTDGRFYRYEWYI